ncbi:hypothetical protein VDG1235_4408 [Verrucomicrobiia bacterium DG1235]|nr:hypothetical protein VDG1235_4408 [Verrucomicrobiae bacterium DG1235]
MERSCSDTCLNASKAIRSTNFRAHAKIASPQDLRRDFPDTNSIAL